MGTIVTLLIIAVLLTISIGAFSSSRTASQRVHALAAVRAVGTAIDDFRKDHGGRPPVLGNAKDWPAPTADGPRNTINDRPYLRRGPPDALVNGVATLTNLGGSAPSRWRISYERSATPPWGWRLTLIDSTGASPSCAMAGGTMTIPKQVIPC